VEKADAFVGAKVVHLNVLHHTSLLFTFLLALFLFLLGMGLARLINLNVFSLHGGYRNRLIRAFLGASRPPGARKPNPFTGFDPADNIAMHELRPALFAEDDFPDPEGLTAALLDANRPLSKYFLDRDALQNLKARPSKVASPGVVAALRTDLNAVLEEQTLYSQPFAWNPSDPALAAHVHSLLAARLHTLKLRKAEHVPPRSDYHVLLNRIVLEAVYHGMIRPWQNPPPPSEMFHVISTTLNLVGGDRLAWQQRKAEPFTVSPLHSGCFRLGYRRSRDYGGRDTGGISIGTAAAISGAAASSNMGYYTTSPVISLLLTLFNVRLGWWLGNPGPAGIAPPSWARRAFARLLGSPHPEAEKIFERDSPKYSVSPVLYEAFGLTNDTYKYVYLTDGGHFENLAIYEMVLRRCHVIVISDAAADEKYQFTDLGNAVRKIRIDLGVPIEFPYMPIYARAPQKGRGMYWALAKIRYTCVDRGTDASGQPIRDGVLLYIKPAVYGDEPRDVLEYKESYPAFPHQSTGDQFFDEPQFESYRALGSHIMDRLLGEEPDPKNPLNLFKMLRRAYNRLEREQKAEGKEVDETFRTWMEDWLDRDE
jgi:hypothetical protein